MDVTCVCGEPWDTYHLKHDEVYETALPRREQDAFARGEMRLTADIREAFAALGWKFGASVLAVLRCPACPKDEKPEDVPESERARRRFRADARAALAELLGDDEDGLACELEDLAAMEERHDG